MGWLTGTLTYTAPSSRVIDGKLVTGTSYSTDALVINDVLSLARNRYFIGRIRDVGTTNRLTLFALLDTANEVFEKSLVLRRSLDYKPDTKTNTSSINSRNIKVAVETITVYVKFRRISNTISTTLLNKIQAEIAIAEENRLAHTSDKINDYTGLPVHIMVVTTLDFL